MGRAIDIMEQELHTSTEMAVNLFNTYGLNIISAILILIFGWMLAGWSKKFVIRLLNKSPKIDNTLTAFFASLVRYAILIFTRKSVV